MMIACVMCGGVVEAALPLVAAGMATVGAELYNRARRAHYNRRAELAARLNSRLAKVRAEHSRQAGRQLSPVELAELARVANCDAIELAAS